jgi:hypothetical protein
VKQSLQIVILFVKKKTNPDDLLYVNRGLSYSKKIPSGSEHIDKSPGGIKKKSSNKL